RISLALNVDEASRAIRELRVEGRRVQAELLRSGQRELAGLVDLARVRVDRGCDLPDRERLAVAIDDGAARCGNDDGLTVLPQGHRGVLGALHDLDPDRACERRREEQEERCREQHDAAIRRRRLHFPSWMYVVSSGSTSTSPSSPRARRSMRVVAAALEISARRPAMSVFSCVRSRPLSSSWRLSRNTATFTATTPESRTAKITIQRTPPLRTHERRRGTGLVRTRGALATWATVDIRRAPPPGGAQRRRAGCGRSRARRGELASR